MITPKETGRKKVNFMVDNNVMFQIIKWVPAGERSDFVNHALRQAVQDVARKMASEMMDKIRKDANLKMTNKEIHKEIEYGRK